MHVKNKFFYRRTFAMHHTNKVRDLIKRHHKFAKSGVAQCSGVINVRGGGTTVTNCSSDALSTASIKIDTINLVSEEKIRPANRKNGNAEDQQETLAVN